MQDSLDLVIRIEALKAEYATHEELVESMTVLKKEIKQLEERKQVLEDGQTQEFRVQQDLEEVEARYVEATNCLREGIEGLR